MFFPEHIVAWLNKRYHQGYSEHLAKKRKRIREVFESIGVPADSEIGHFYLQFGPGTHGGWYELLEVDEMSEWIEYAKEELELDDDYLPLTSIEGEGITLYRKSTGQVFDVEYGQFESLENNTLKSIGETFLEFLEWSKQRDEKV